MKPERDFKGVWIPKGIWLNDELSLQEKVFLVEIDSLDNENGCFAGNQYFADFFSLKITRTSQIINNLIKKGYIDANYIRKDNQIVKRVLTIKCKNLFNILYEPIKNSVRTPLEKCRDNNTYNNTYNKGGKPRFTKPTKELVSLYCKEIKFDLDIDYFFDYQDARAWELSKGRKIKDWKAVIRTWHKNSNKWEKPSKKSRYKEITPINELPEDK